VGAIRVIASNNQTWQGIADVIVDALSQLIRADSRLHEMGGAVDSTTMIHKLLIALSPMTLVPKLAKQMQQVGFGTAIQRFLRVGGGDDKSNDQTATMKELVLDILGNLAAVPETRASLLEGGLPSILFRLAAAPFQSGTLIADFPRLAQRGTTAPSEMTNTYLSAVMRVLAFLACTPHPALKEAIRGQDAVVVSMLKIWTGHDDLLAEQAAFILFSCGVCTSPDEVSRLLVLLRLLVGRSD
jgi:hypothetical protein